MQHTKQSDATTTAIEEASEADQKQQEQSNAKAAAIQSRNELAEKIRLSMKPSTEGTVAEVAKKLGISKSEVRRRRRAGEM